MPLSVGERHASPLPQLDGYVRTNLNMEQLKQTLSAMVQKIDSLAERL
jgi:hypothetical protein